MLCCMQLSSTVTEHTHTHTQCLQVFLYVMNAKKANVPKDELDAVQQRKRQQQQAAIQVRQGVHGPPLDQSPGRPPVAPGMVYFLLED